MQMEEDEINRLNNIIKNHINIIRQIQNENNQLQRQNKNLKDKVDELQKMLGQDPLSQILNSINEMNQQRQQIQYRSKISVKNNKMFYQDYNKALLNQVQTYRNQLRIKNKLIQEQTLSISKGQEELMILNNQKVQLKQKIDEFKRKYQFQIKKNTTLQNCLKQSKQKNKKQKEEIYTQLRYFQEQRRKFQQMSQLFEQSFIQEAEIIKRQNQKQAFLQCQSEEKLKNIIQKKKEQEIIMEEMGVQLDQRNQQLAKFISLGNQSQKNNLSLNQNVLKMNNIFLKSQLIKKSQFIRGILLRLKNLDQVNLIQQNQNKNLKQQLKELRKLKNSDKQQKRQIQKLTIDNSLLINKLQILETQKEEQYKNMYLLLLENEAYHKFMQQQFGTKLYLNQIKIARDKMEKQMKERGLKEKWVSVDELIKMNRKLMHKN